jgi:hypothetical protein
MNFDNQILHTFNLHKQKPSTQQENHSLTNIGYPSLYQVSFFITYENLTLWKNKKEIHFPDRCCICKNQKSELLPCYKKSISFLFNKQQLIINSVPHCREHSQQNHCQLIVSIAHWTDSVIQISLTSTNLEFIIETKKLNHPGCVIPPWVAFPEYDIYTGGWRQGNGEYWWHNVWLPFWSNMSTSERQSYLKQYSASKDWLEYLMPF